jgi:hypothetical protein
MCSHNYLSHRVYDSRGKQPSRINVHVTSQMKDKRSNNHGVKKYNFHTLKIGQSRYYVCTVESANKMRRAVHTYCKRVKSFICITRKTENGISISRISL